MSNPQPLVVSLQVEARAPGEVIGRPVAPGGELRSGDRFRLLVEVSADAELLVVHLQRQGWSDVLFPPGGPTRVAAGQRLVLPGPGSDYTLDERVGEEVICAVASRGALGAELLAQLRVPPAGGSRGDDPPPPPPDVLDPKDRPTELLRGEQRAQAEERDGVALLRFTFHHVG